jgi:hypothetical protein
MSHLVAGRAQMGTSLAFHLSFAVFGVGLPVMMLIAEGVHLRTGDRVWLALARRWSKAFAIPFAVRAVSGLALLMSALPGAAPITAAAGAWLAASPWALGYAALGATAWSADLLAGVILIALGVRARHGRDQRTRPGPRPRPRA